MSQKSIINQGKVLCNSVIMNYVWMSQTMILKKNLTNL